MIDFPFFGGVGSSLRSVHRHGLIKQVDPHALPSPCAPCSMLPAVIRPSPFTVCLFGCTRYRRIAAFNRKCGIDVQELSPREVEDLFPLCKTDDLLAGFYVADDGRVNPVDASMALAKGARAQGARIIEGVTVSGVTQAHGCVTGVTVADGQTIAAEYVVNCAGMWARQFGELAGVCVPNQAGRNPP